MNAECLKIDRECVVESLHKVGEKLDPADGQLAVDFSDVRRIDASTLGALEELAGLADHKAVKVVLKGVNIEIYKVLTLVRLAPRFSFLN